jgi:peptidoglycan/xylan/chitin deacetylase (PgdA/CDA1 family)
MSDEEILELRAKGFEIGAHGMSHHNLTELNSEQIHQEIYESKHMIEALLNEEIISFAYPYGQVNRSVERLVAQGGFKFGCGVYTGPPKFGDNLYNIRRLAIKLHTTTFRFLLKILAPYEYVEWLYWKAFHMKIADPQYPAKQNAHWHHRFSPTKNFQNSDS